MTEQQIIKSVREAGAINRGGCFVFSKNELNKLVGVVAAHAKAEERERCAMVCDEKHLTTATPSDCADAIRALKD